MEFGRNGKSYTGCVYISPCQTATPEAGLQAFLGGAYSTAGPSPGFSSATGVTGGVDSPIGGIGGAVLSDNKGPSNGVAIGGNISVGPGVAAPVNAGLITCQWQKWCI